MGQDWNIYEDEKKHIILMGKKYKTKTIIVPSNIDMIQEFKFEKFEEIDGIRVIIPFSVKRIFPYAFALQDVEEVYLPDDIVIGSRAFYNTKIEELILPRHIQIGEEAFSTSNLKKLTMCDTKDHSDNFFTKFGWGNGCPIEELTIENSGKAFSILKDLYNQGLKDLTKIIITNMPLDYWELDKLQNLFKNTTFEYKAVTKLNINDQTWIIKNGILYAYLEQDTDIQIPEGVEVINHCSFLQKDIQNVTFPNSLRIIKECAFETKRFNSISLPPNIEEIENYAFYKNELEKVVMSPSIKKLGRKPFSGYVKRLVIYSSTIGIFQSSEDMMPSISSLTIINDDGNALDMYNILKNISVKMSRVIFADTEDSKPLHLSKATCKYLELKYYLKTKRKIKVSYQKFYEEQEQSKEKELPIQIEDEDIEKILEQLEKALDKLPDDAKQKITSYIDSLLKEYIKTLCDIKPVLLETKSVELQIDYTSPITLKSKLLSNLEMLLYRLNCNSKTDSAKIEEYKKILTEPYIPQDREFHTTQITIEDKLHYIRYVKEKYGVNLFLDKLMTIIEEFSHFNLDELTGIDKDNILNHSLTPKSLNEKIEETYVKSQLLEKFMNSFLGETFDDISFSILNIKDFIKRLDATTKQRILIMLKELQKQIPIIIDELTPDEVELELRKRIKGILNVILSLDLFTINKNLLLEELERCLNILKYEENDYQNVLTSMLQDIITQLKNEKIDKDNKKEIIDSLKEILEKWIKFLKAHEKNDNGPLPITSLNT